MKAALWFHVGKIVDEETLRLGTTATNQFTAGLTEIVWAQIGKIYIEGLSLSVRRGSLTVVNHTLIPTSLRLTSTQKARV